MNIFYIASECTPFIASGGLGDVMGALPKAVSESGHRVSVLLPFYKQLRIKDKSKLTLVKNLTFNLSWRTVGASVYMLDSGGVCYYFFENHYYFDRERLYGEFDDAERFAFFSRAVIEFILTLDSPPDIIHANDWQTALSVIYAKTEYKDFRKISGIRCVFTIHNIEYQGKFPQNILGDVLGIMDSRRELLVYGGSLNLLAGALKCADFITTVSPTYSEELKYDFFGFGLSELIKEVSYKTLGVINGIDYSYFSPTKDGDIYKTYSKKDATSGKYENKMALAEELSLTLCEKTPMISMITRLVEGKGVELVLHILEELLSEDLFLIILGTGDKKYEEAFIDAAKRHGNLHVILKFDRVLSKKIYAATDIFLMPSKSEPCGLSQMIATSYGAVPVVRSVGGLRDSIIPFPAKNANGFRFDNYNAHELLFKIKEALTLYKNGSAWRELCNSAMSSDFSWGVSAQKYISIYENITKG